MRQDGGWRRANRRGEIGAIGCPRRRISDASVNFPVEQATPEFQVVDQAISSAFVSRFTASPVHPFAALILEAFIQHVRDLRVTFACFNDFVL